MNLRRGFRRITFVLAIVIAIFCAFCAVMLVLDEHDSTQSYLRWKEGQYREKYGALSSPPKGFVIDEPKKEGEHKPDIFDRIVEEKRIAEEELRELKNSFWVNLPLSRLVGLCVLAGLGGATVGYCFVWLVYKFLEWLVLGFCRTADADVEQKSKTDE